MSTRPIVALCLVGLAVAAATPAQAKAAPFHGSYSVTLLPDPTTDVSNSGGKPGCTGSSPKGTDHHPLSIPAKGKLTVDLVSTDPTGKGVTDWDVYIETAGGDILASGNGPTSSEEAVYKFPKGQAIQIVACNLAGQPSGTITYVYKPA